MSFPGQSPHAAAHNAAHHNAERFAQHSRDAHAAMVADHHRAIAAHHGGAPHRSSSRYHRRQSSAATVVGFFGRLIGFVFTLAVLAFIGAVLLLVIRPSQPELLVELTHWLDGLVSLLRR